MLLRLYKRLLPFARPYTGKIVLAAIFNIISNFVGTVNLFAILPIIAVIFGEKQSVPGTSNVLDKLSSYLIGDTPIASLVRVCAFVFFTYLVKNIFEYINKYIMVLVENGMGRRLRDTLFEKLSTLSLDYYYERKSGQLLSRLTNDVGMVNGTLVGSIMTVIGQPVQIVVVLGGMMLMSWRMTIVSIVIAALSLWLVRLFRNTLKNMSHRLQSLLGDILSVAQEMIGGIKVVKSFGMERYEVNRFKAETEQHYHGSRRLARVRNLMSPINETLAVLGFIGILWFGGQEVFAHQLKGSELILFLLSLIYLMQPVKTLSEVNGRLYEASAAAENLFTILDAEATVKPGIVTAPRTITQPIRFEQVAFRYRSATENAINGIDLEIYPNEVLALVGPSGAGKTTLVDLLVRFYDPTEGRIFLDGRDIRDYDFESLRALFGIVTQDTLLFHDTILSNIAYGNRDASQEMIYEAAKAANAHDFIQQLPNGYNTLVGDRGVRLSGGQRQRIAIARALLKDPPILIFDEATSALDTENEMLVQEAIQNLLHHRTAVVIAHRLSTIQQADRIVVMDKGKIVETGSHDDLLSVDGGLYKRLYTIQMRAGSEGVVSVS